MQRQLLVPFAVCLMTTTTQTIAQNWEPAPALPTGGAARVHAVGVNQNGTLFAIGGTPWQNGGDMDGSVHRLLPGAAAWTSVTPLSGEGPIVGMAGGVDSLGRIVLFGGYLLNDDGPGSEFTYEPIDGPTGGVASRNAPGTATGPTAFATDDLGRIYGIGGGLGAGEGNSGYCDRYDASSDSWETLASMTTPAAEACAAFDGDGHILVCGGINAAGTARIANVARYDIATNTWSDTAVPDLPVALSGGSAARGIDGRIYVAGGETGPLGAGVTQSAVYRWEPAGNAWTSVASMATPRTHFALVLGDDDYLYAIGGDNETGGTDSVEKLFTPRCPTFNVQPGDLDAWSGTIAGFSAAVTGASPFEFQWRRDGQPLSDGPTGLGSTIQGATTSSLTISTPSVADEAAYDIVVTNACGATMSAVAVLTIRQTPIVPTLWKVTNLHPAWAQDSSYARGISNGRIGGEAVTPTLMPDGRTLTLGHPVVWETPTSSGVDITPAGSVGGGIRDAAGDYFVGWYWHTYSCPSGGQTWTCGWQSAAYWAGANLAFTEAPHGSGPEYDIAAGTDGERIVGTLTYEYTEGNYTSYATMWTPPASGQSLHPSGVASNSSASAVDGAYQYGSYNTPLPGPSTHAARWSGSSATFVDIHPDGFSRSWVSGAADGQAVGTAVLGSTNHAMMWVGATTIDLTPGGLAGNATDADGGLQIGDVGSHAAIWAGTPESYFDLNSVLPPDYSGATADSIEVAEDGTVRVVGSGYVPARSRYEAIVWESLPDVPAGDANCDGVVNAMDVSVFATVLAGVDSEVCHVNAADMNEDGNANGDDIQLFVGALIGN
ncbi:MAG: hypothetical protein H6819_06215 [Phycisphaerales bacterium]|nr:hypothetical protein [Phycisphaerales bacterium]MCB9858585.1 hypothetical protein [Phycisphaerales bacterium]